MPVGEAAVFEIGGADQVSYGEIMQEYARQCGLRRWMIPVPVLTPRLSSLWLGLVTPIYARIGRKLVDSMRNPTLVRNPSALKVFDIRPKGLKDAIERALHNENLEFAETSWSDALSLCRKDPVVGRRALRNPARRLSYAAGPRYTGSGICTHPTNWRSERLVLCQRSVVVARVSGSSIRRSRNAPGATQHSDLHSFRIGHRLAAKPLPVTTPAASEADPIRC